MKTSEKFPTYVNIDKVDDEKYLFNALLNKTQLEDLRHIAHEYRAKRQGQYHAMVYAIEQAIDDLLGKE